MTDHNPWTGKKPKYRDGRANNRPPEQNRYKPGQSGNLKGRPRGSLGFNALMSKMLKEKVAVRVGNVIREISWGEALMRAWLQRAAKGDAKALRALREAMPDEPPLVERMPIVHLCFIDDGGDYPGVIK
jgi:hypothetical protein